MTDLGTGLSQVRYWNVEPENSFSADFCHKQLAQQTCQTRT